MSGDRCRSFAGLALDCLLVIGLSVVVVSHRAVYDDDIRVVIGT